MATALEKAAVALEWPRFLQRCLAEVRTEPGKLRVLALGDPARWAPDIATARTLQQETQEAVPLLEKESLWGPLLELPDLSETLERMGKGSVLEVTELSALRRWLYAVDNWTQVPREEIRGERLRKDIAKLMDPFDPLRLLDKLLTPEGELSENASPRLSQLYSEIRGLRREIGVVLDQVLKTLSTKGVLQENFSDVRDGRYVIPIKISAQNDVEGIIYEASASRQTVFVEPREVGQLNNRLRQRQNDLIQEVYAVLEAASKRLHPLTADIASSAEILTHWDSVQARARFGRRFSGRTITVTDEWAFRLRHTAHPMLWWSLAPEQIIRNDVDFGEPTRTLLLTGPNTGGKTVLLKTLGLAGICARTGFPFPAADHPEVPFCDSFFADVGDPQSIEEHLSSFSGHIQRYKEIFDLLGARSLVLLDELNSATDPEEGAALGRAFLETIMRRGALIVATTHDPHLKAMAVSDERIENASMAFDEGARTPTYRIVLGVPGRSRALETAERLGIPGEVLLLARSYLSSQHNQFEAMLSKLENDASEAARARKEAVALRDEAEALKKEWTERTESAVGEMLERTRARLKRVLEQAQDEVRASVQKLDELRNRKDIDRTRVQLNETAAEASRRVESALTEEAPELVDALSRHKAAEEAASARASQLKLEKGTLVRVPKWKATGTVLEVSGNKIKVAMGTLQMTVAPSEIEPLGESEKRALKGSGGSPRARISGAEVPVPPSQLDLRGKRYDEAMSELEQYIDQAFRCGSLAEVTIVHGLGSGALREGTVQLLKSLPYVRSFHDGGAGRGGSGATVVEFER